MKPRDYIVSLALSFPCLKEKWGHQLTPETWDVDALMKGIRGWSNAERQCALFVASVWNPSYAESRKWRFDVMTAMGCWDNGNRRAFVTWAANPYWP